jgi:alkylhydroperoxidase family enzyme
MTRYLIAIAIAVVIPLEAGRAADPPSDAPKPVPATRPEMKAALEALKSRTPRLPLPEAGAQDGVNNGQMRAAYLPESWSAGRGRGNSQGNRQQGRGARAFHNFGQDPNSTMDFAFTTSLFWVVSRGNNCHYCLGHQELKLRGAGLDDDTIASLDSDWSIFDPRQQAALAYARRLTLEPQLVGDKDVAALKLLFSDAEIVELTYNISRFNSTNRWTDGMGIPQDQRFGEEDNSLNTATNERFQQTTSIVTPMTRTARLPLPSVEEVEHAIDSCRQRIARVELTDIAPLPVPHGDRAWGDRRSPLEWERAMSQLADTGSAQVASLNTIMTDGHLPLRLKAELALISAIHNRAWYAVAHAVHRLQELGVSADEMAALFDESQAANGASSAHRLAAKLTADPHLITDADIAMVRENFSDAETAQIVHVICMANMFDRFTAALGLPLEDGICE